MTRNERYFHPLMLVGMVVVLTIALLEFGFVSIDEESYTYLTKSLVENRQFNFETDYSKTGSELHRAHLGVVSGDEIYSAFPPGYPFLAIPFYYLFGINGMQITNIFFTVLLALLFYFFVREYSSEENAFFASIILIAGTQILNYSISVWSHVPSAFFILLSFYLMFKGRSGLSGVAIGASMIIRYSGIAVVPFLAWYLFRNDKKKIPEFIGAVVVGLIPLLYYNFKSFGSFFISGMTILNLEEGYNAINLVNIPKNLITNLIHYTFFPFLELMPSKASLLETSPFIAFFTLGAYHLYKEKPGYRDELYALAGAILGFILFISGTWSLGGLSHNMRLLTDILPLITFFSVLGVFQLKINLKMLTASLLFFTILGFFKNIPFHWLKFYNLTIAAISLSVIAAMILLQKKVGREKWKTALSILFLLTIGMSVFTSVSITKIESANRKSVREAAQTFENAVPEGSVVFMFFGDYPAYTEKNYIFLDHSKKSEDMEHVLDYYKNQSKFVIIKREEETDIFIRYKLIKMNPVRTYNIIQKP